MNGAAKLDADRAFALSLTPVSRETEERLSRYVSLLQEWQKTTNLIAHSTLATIWSRHVADSLQLRELLPDAVRWIDLGSGAGFPGIPLACTLANTAGAHVYLVERNTKKAAFLREAVRVTAAPASVHVANIEDFVDSFDGAADCVTARAVAPLKVLIEQSERLIQRGAKAAFLKGQDIEFELTEAAKCWKISYELLPSKTHRGGRIIVIDAVTPLPRHLTVTTTSPQ
jgi:16S rRNA (guanine527-N7)-methyltransferase